jgi:predicted GIY-YIG superfamily endonuclease
VYIGETGRDLPTRLNEHRAHGRKGDIEKSSIVKHSYTEDHTINWDQAKLITSIEHWYPRRIREAIEIYRHNTVPQDIGVNISDIWRPILKPSPVSDGSPIP